MKMGLFTQLVIYFFYSAFAVAETTQPSVAFPDIKSDKNFVQIKPGSFGMGSPKNEVDRFYDEDLHQVTITKEFEIQNTMVTQEQYFLVSGKSPSLFSRKEFCPESYVEVNSFGLCPKNPVERVSWDDTQIFIQKLNTIDKKYNYRLPTEAEWEYTARAGAPTAFWFGDSVDKVQYFSWYGRNALGITKPVGFKPANAFGLYDAHGNVWQWTQDWYGLYPAEAQVDPTGFKDGVTKVLRGGSIFSPPTDLRAAARAHIPPHGWGQDIGFRLVRTLK